MKIERNESRKGYDCSLKPPASGRSSENIMERERGLHTRSTTSKAGGPVSRSNSIVENVFPRVFCRVLLSLDPPSLESNRTHDGSWSKESLELHEKSGRPLHSEHGALRGWLLVYWQLWESTMLRRLPTMGCLSHGKATGALYYSPSRLTAISVLW